MSAWKSRWSWVRLVNRASSKRTASTRCRASACEETSIAQARSPPCSMRLKVSWRSIDSGVVRSTSSSTAPTTCLTVPSRPDWIAAASSTSLSRKAVVVLPLVPVMPATRSSAVGLPLKRAATGAIAARASATTTCGTRSSGSSRSTTSAAARRSTAPAAKSCPSAFSPTTQKKSVPGLDPAAVVGEGGDAHAGVPDDPDRISRRGKVFQSHGAILGRGSGARPPIRPEPPDRGARIRRSCRRPERRRSRRRFRPGARRRSPRPAAAGSGPARSR